ncbi:ABC transporter ATP-binding protein [Parashewanella spongiae]|nr:ABC transporter ATP-binding protein [Parashewanella spongiae]
METVGRVNKLSFGYKENIVLNDVNLKIKQGETLSILGPNGAGKTTLIKAMLGQIKPKKGEISLLGYQAGDIGIRRLTGVMLQVSGVPDMSTVSEHIKLFQSYYPNPMSYQKVLGYSGLQEKEHEYSKNLSGGQKQRLLFALAICGNPKVLFLDEPTVGMDIDSRKALWEAIEQLKLTGTSIVLTTHYLEEADRLSDRVVILNRGNIIHEGTPKEIKTLIQVKCIKFTCNVEITNVSRAVNLSSHYDSDLQQFQYTIESSCAEETLKELFNRNVPLSDLTVTGADLEQAFTMINSLDDNSETILEVE